MTKNQSPGLLPKSFLFAIVALFLFILSLYPLRWWPLNWIAWGLLITVVLDRSLSWKQYIGAIYCLALGLFVYIGWRIYDYEPSLCILSIGAAIFIFLGTLILLRWLTLKSTDTSQALIILPCAWIIIHTLLEYLPLATITTDILFDSPLVMMQSASLAGIKLYHAAFLGFLTSVVLLIKNEKNKEAKTALAIYISILVLLASYGGSRLHSASKAVNGPQTALIQHNLTPDVLWRIHNNDSIVQTYIEWAKKAKTQNAELIIYPQYDIGKDTFRSPDLIAGMAEQINSYMIFSSYIAASANADNDDFKNMAFLYGPDGKRLSIYESIEPFPFRRHPPIASKTYRLMQSPWGFIGMHVCYENALARIVRKSVQMGAQVHIDLANPGFFNQTVIPQYHLLQDKLRAIETGQYVYRVTTNGNTGVIDGRGRIEQLTQLNEAKMIMTHMQLMPSSTLYMKVPFLLPILAACMIIFQFARRQPKPASGVGII